MKINRVRSLKEDSLKPSRLTPIDELDRHFCACGTPVISENLWVSNSSSSGSDWEFDGPYSRRRTDLIQIRRGLLFAIMQSLGSSRLFTPGV